ncbi:hypothetical protein L6R53_15875 [Myxococcota bacterium]|nr:hypothetical protein [Myxococcota bacterium]
MAHHKRGRPKSRRAGCLLCKPHKDQRRKDTAGARTRAEQRAVDRERQQREEEAGVSESGRG